MADSFLPPVIVELTANDTGALKAIRGLVSALKAVPEPAQAAADALRVVQEAATAMGDGIVGPLDAAKKSIRGLASAMRALGKAAATTDDEGRTAMQQIAASAQEMGTSVTEAANASRTSLASMGREFRTVAGESAAAAAETATAARESAVSAEESGAAAASAGRKSSLAMGESSGALMKYATGLAGAAFGIFETVKASTRFNAQMTRLVTQAGVAKSQLGALSTGVLNLAGQVGFSPQSLAKSLYYVESNFESMGITSSQALELVKTAAEGAKTGGSDLVETTTALNAAVASGIPGVQNYTQAMGALNAIVGTGEMTMEDLVKALGTGVLAVVKGYGLSITDVGAALTTFGDNNIRGAVAATDLRMAVQALAVPAKGSEAQLRSLGLTSKSLADDMQKGGLKLALNDLIGRFRKAGITAKEQGQVITDLFGKKAGAGLAILLGNMDRVNSKYPALEQAAHSFGGAWKTASKTASAEFDKMKSSLEALGIKIGNILLPPLTKFLGWVQKGISWITQHKAAVQALAAVVAGALVAALWGVVSALAAMEASPVILTITGIAAALIFAYEHFKGFREMVNTVAVFLKNVFVGAIHLARAAIRDLVSWWQGHKQVFIAAWHEVVKAVQVAVKWFDQNVLVWVRARIADLVTWWHAHSQQISEVWSVVWKTISAVVKAAWDGTIKPTLTVIEAYWKLVWGVIRDSFKLVWNVIKDVVTTVMHNILGTIGVVLDLLTGKWGKAWRDVKSLVSTGLHDVVHLISDIGSGFGNLLYNAGANIINGLVNGIKSAIGAVGSVMSDVTNYITGFLPHSPAKWGPLTGNGSPEHGGRSIARHLAQGILGGQGDVAAAMGRLSGTAALAMGGSTTGALAVRPGGTTGAGGQVQVINVTVQGHVLRDKELYDVVQTQALRYGRRNPTTGLTY